MRAHPTAGPTNRNGAAQRGGKGGGTPDGSVGPAGVGGTPHGSGAARQTAIPCGAALRRASHGMTGRDSRVEQGSDRLRQHEEARGVAGRWRSASPALLPVDPAASSLTGRQRRAPAGCPGSRLGQTRLGQNAPRPNGPAAPASGPEAQPGPGSTSDAGAGTPRPRTTTANPPSARGSRSRAIDERSRR